MHKTRLVAALLASTIAAITYAATNEIRWDKQSIVRVAVYEDAGGGAKRKVFVESTLAIVPGRPFDLASGGVLGETGLKVGTKITGKIEPTDDGLAQVELRISASESVHQPNDRDTKLIRTMAFDIRTIAAVGQTVRLNCSNSQWCELTIDP